MLLREGNKYCEDIPNFLDDKFNVVYVIIFLIVYYLPEYKNFYNIFHQNTCRYYPTTIV